MVFVHYQHRAYINMQMSCTTPARIQIQKNVTRTMDMVCVFQFERMVYHLRWQVLQICCTDCSIDETCARHTIQCSVVPETTSAMFIRNDRICTI